MATMNGALRKRCFIGLCLVIAGCGGPEYTGAQRYPLSGKVTADGQPIDLGSISFIPVDGDKQRVSGGEIIDGAYTVPESRGANDGKYKVEIRWQKKTGKQVMDDRLGEMVDERKEGLPDKFHLKSELTAEVSEKQTTFDFDLKPN